MPPIPHKKPDLNGPRYRPTKLNLTNEGFFQSFLKEYPKYNGVITAPQFKSVISSFNGKIWQNVVEKRDGVELPEQLGYIFIGTCPRAKKLNVDYDKSKIYGVKVQNQNWESDQYLAKIFYTSYESKYKFKHHDMWGFKGVRSFTRTVAEVYPKEWKKYVVAENFIKISRIFRKESFKQARQKKNAKTLESYDEFSLDD